MAAVSCAFPKRRATTASYSKSARSVEWTDGLRSSGPGLRRGLVGDVILRVKPAQLALEHLAGARERERLGSNIDAARTFVTGDAVLAEGDNLDGIDAGAGFRDHEGVDGLAPLFAGDADHRALRHRRMLRDHVLDFHRIDVLAAGNDHVFDAVDQIDIAFLIHVAAVAGVHP